MKVQPNDYSKIYDLAVIGGGINGVGIANDAAGGADYRYFYVKKMI